MDKVITENKKALFDYQVLEKFKAGIVLRGFEVKAIKSGKINIRGSFVVFKGDELFLIGANIPPYQPANTPKTYNPEASRKLLLKKSEIKSLIGKAKQKGLTMIPLKVYTDKGKIKVEFALCRHKKKIDKREKIKKREAEREIRRQLKGDARR